ncbi:MAG: PstS family phosphate ABC transporter substrate-binding protein [bacterium]|nr:PstS family phosphate ABC transporter substrate-binding protein [bacterium]MDE0600883.1 PstS family phosphate ABC transporter substrate-binding protein [bacterium]
MNFANRHLLRWGAALSALLLLAAACGGDDDRDAPATTAAPANGDAPAPEGLSGSIEVSGSSTVEPITALVAEKFNSANPGVGISVEGPGTGDGFQRFCAGETDISDASRPIKDSEAEACAEAGVEWVELKVAFDGISVLTSPENDAVSCLDTGDLYALAGAESEGFSSWSDANGLAAELAAAGLGGSGAPYPDAPLVITAPGEESGTFDAFVELALEDITEERGQDEPTRVDYQASANDNVIVDNVSSNPTSFGWVGFAFFAENSSVLKAIEVDGGDGCVTPSIDSIADGSYPLSRPLFIYVSLSRMTDNPALGPFVDFYLGDGLSSVAEAGYVTLPDDEVSATKAAWAGAG